MSEHRILYCYPYPPSDYNDAQELVLAGIERFRAAGFDVEPFCITPDPPRYPFPFKQLDLLWKAGDKRLHSMYEALECRLEGKDILINSCGVNLHPEFVAKLPVFTVFLFADDPESSEIHSRPVAAAYDLCLVANAAEVDMYHTWGAQAEWIPMGFSANMYDPSLTFEKILTGERDVDLFMMIDRLAPWRDRKARLDKLAAVFTDGHFYGRGWPRGYLPQEQQVMMLQRTKIGPNLHNSTGPINTRTFYLPANGVLQVCDNKSHLGTVFEVGKEVVGFDSVEECIDLCRYYLDHDEERRGIAANGWRRAVQDYNQIAVFQRTIDLIDLYRGGRISSRDEQVSISLHHAQSLSSRQRMKSRILLIWQKALRLQRLQAWLQRRWHMIAKQ